MNNTKTYSLLTYFILGIFSFFFNFWVSNKGVFPIDTFLHYDSAYKILNGEIPVRDFWVIHGLTIDYIQSIFFYFFGTNWISYIAHSSIFNCIMTLLIFNFFKKLEINILYALILSICFSVLAYPISGVPFIDHHSTFFSIIGLLCFYYGFEKKNYNYYFLIPFIFGLAFLAKPVPATYIFILLLGLLLINIYFTKDLKILYKLILGSFSALIIFAIFLKFQNIPFKNFLEQLILYPVSIGGQRFDIILNSMQNRIFNFKFLVIPILFLFYLLFYKRNFSKIKKSDLVICFAIVTLNLILIFHQLLTKNQNFIFFLIPINIGLIIYVGRKINFKYKNYLNIFFLIATVILTIKYNERFNFERKFHDLQNVNLDNFSQASDIDKTLYPLKWQSNIFFDSTEEIKLINKLIGTINSSSKNILLISNYNFLDSITQKKLYLIVKNYDNVTIPPQNNKYYPIFKSFFNQKLIDRDIKEIILFLPNENISQIKIKFDNLLKKNCFEIENLDKAITKLNLRNC